MGGFPGRVSRSPGPVSSEKAPGDEKIMQASVTGITWLPGTLYQPRSVSDTAQIQIPIDDTYVFKTRAQLRPER